MFTFSNYEKRQEPCEIQASRGFCLCFQYISPVNRLRFLTCGFVKVKDR